jgi:hypothetical protein
MQRNDDLVENLKGLEKGTASAREPTGCGTMDVERGRSRGGGASGKYLFQNT